MSREIIPQLRWGIILKKFRDDAGLNQTQIAEAIGYSDNSKSDVSYIEQGKLAINEEKVRLWIKRCGRTMAEFYVIAIGLESATSVLDYFGIPKKSR